MLQHWLPGRSKCAWDEAEGPKVRLLQLGVLGFRLAQQGHVGVGVFPGGKVRLMNYFTPSNAVQEARNATGGGYHSDGRVLVIFVQ